MKLFSLILLLSLPLITFGELTVASLNPVVSDLAKQVGGERVKVIELMKAGENPHAYTPNPEQLRAARQARLILAAGKGLESYLPDVRDNLTTEQQILEVGKTIPSLTTGHGGICTGCPDHKHNTVDPHWWHSIKNIKRAVRIIAKALSECSPDDRDYFNAQSQNYCIKMDALEIWAKKEISKIPRKDRILTTAHNSFGYFCHDFGFQAAPIQGLSSETTPKPKQITAIVKTIKSKNIKAVFPEKSVNPKLLRTVVQETGVKTGEPLLAGGPDPKKPTCEAMMRYNISVIVRALKH